MESLIDCYVLIEIGELLTVPTRDFNELYRALLYQ